jgi:ABC-type Zn2+ transport system substrate-binding protein/surface adhesin
VRGIASVKLRLSFEAKGCCKTKNKNKRTKKQKSKHKHKHKHKHNQTIMHEPQNIEIDCIALQCTEAADIGRSSKQKQQKQQNSSGDRKRLDESKARNNEAGCGWKLEQFFRNEKSAVEG